MRVMSFNTNGIRAAQRKGFFEWMAAQAPDVVCIQELKAQRKRVIAGRSRPPKPRGCSTRKNPFSRKDATVSALRRQVSSPASARVRNTS